MEIQQVSARLDEVARRAGLRNVPPAVLGAVALVTVAAVVFAFVRWWPSEGGAEAAVTFESGRESVEASVPAAVVSQEASATQVWVHVVGAVMRPGVYRLPGGSRVADAIDAAGGLLGSAAQQGVNLAREVADGEQVAVPTLDEFASGKAPAAPSTSGSGAAGGSTQGGLVDLNSADVAALDALPGIGPSTAAKIIADREANGPFATVEDLGRVSGIGDKKLEQLAGLICVR